MTQELLRQAAQAVLDRWNSPMWDWHKQGPTADLMHALRAAIAQTAKPATYRIEKAEMVWPIAQDKWNALADGYNQWDNLGRDEMSVLIVRETELQLAAIAQTVQPANPVMYQERTDLSGPYSSFQGWTDWRECDKDHYDMIKDNPTIYFTAQSRALIVATIAQPATPKEPS